MTYNFVKLTEEVKAKIDAEKKPRLAPEDAPSGYPVPDKRACLEKGLRTVIKMEDGGELSVQNLNRAGQTLLGKVLPQLFEHLGTDIMNDIETIL